MNKIEEMAKAIYDRRNGLAGTPWRQLDETQKEPYLLDARVMVAYFAKPTPAMLKAGTEEMKRRNWPLPVEYISKLWSVMVEAAAK